MLHLALDMEMLDLAAVKHIEVHLVRRDLNEFCLLLIIAPEPRVLELDALGPASSRAGEKNTKVTPQRLL